MQQARIRIIAVSGKFGYDIKNTVGMQALRGVVHVKLSGSPGGTGHA